MHTHAHTPQFLSSVLQLGEPGLLLRQLGYLAGLPLLGRPQCPLQLVLKEGEVAGELGGVAGDRGADLVLNLGSQMLHKLRARECVCVCVCVCVRTVIDIIITSNMPNIGTE